MPTPTIIPPLSAMPKGLDANTATPTGERILAWGTTKQKYLVEIWRDADDYVLWQRKVYRCQRIKWAGRPEWRVHGTFCNLAQAFLASRPLRESITFGGKPRLMNAIYVHPQVEEIIAQP
jgi:hypothetical protein